MITNINLAAPESKKKTILSGRLSLILSGVILALAIGSYGAIIFLANYYSNQKRQVDNQIQIKNAKISGAEFVEQTDFQERLNLLDKILRDHFSFDGYLKNFSKYVLPEVHLTSLSWENSENKVTVLGIADNFDVLSRQLVLLKNSPIVQSLEFKNAAQSSSAENQKGVTFGLSVKLKTQEKAPGKLNN